MRGVREHVDHAGTAQAIALLTDQNGRVARQCRRAARDVDDAARTVGTKRLDKFQGAFARRVDEHLVEAPESADALRRRREQVRHTILDAIVQAIRRRILGSTANQFGAALDADDTGPRAGNR